MKTSLPNLVTVIGLLLLPLCTSAQQLCTGAEMLLVRDSLPQGRVAVVANQTSVVDSVHLVDTLIARGVKVVKIFCPEHGFRGTIEAGVKVSNGVDSRTGLPIVSLYGNNKKPTQGQMRDVDCVIFDLQDVGCRFYTYLSTLHYVAEACSTRGIPLIVLDRPNPNGHYVDGPVLDTARFRSFVGLHPVPIVYGMTIGEYARMIVGEGWAAPGYEGLEVVAMEGYHRDSIYHLDIPPSPNLRTAQAIALYPSLCLFEGTTISVGRGTPYPFEVIGSLPDTLDLRYAPTPPRINLAHLLAMYERRRTNFFLSNNFFNLLSGTDMLRHQIEAGLTEAEIRQSWRKDIDGFLAIRKRYLIYD